MLRRLRRLPLLHFLTVPFARPSERNEKKGILVCALLSITPTPSPKVPLLAELRVHEGARSEDKIFLTSVATSPLPDPQPSLRYIFQQESSVLGTVKGLRNHWGEDSLVGA